MKKLVPANECVIENLRQKPKYILKEAESVSNDVVKQLQSHCQANKLVDSIKLSENLVRFADAVVILKNYDAGY